jgi:predicted Rossmann fold flavoprotein
MTHQIIVVIGGGAAGIFAALSAARKTPIASVILLEKTRQLLAKVRISGGGRCNVTHALFDPKLLSQNYPRGEKELIGPFHQFQPRDTIAWFAARGVPLKIEEDGRMFPVTDSSETIIECLLKEARSCKVDIRMEQKITAIERAERDFHIHFDHQPTLRCQSILLATGSSPQGYAFAKHFGHTIIPPVPSLFSFNVPTSPLLNLSGITIPDVSLSLKGSPFKQRGPLLLTHWGFSGPAALKLSAWAARFLHEAQYQATLVINWLPHLTLDQITERLVTLKNQKPSRSLDNENIFGLPLNLWKRLVPERTPLSHLSHKGLKQVAEILSSSIYAISGKTTYKQEFVTCGGVCLKEIDFKRMESKMISGLHFAGEVLDIDGITGGFNFQNAWTTGWIAGQAMAHR